MRGWRARDVLEVAINDAEPDKGMVHQLEIKTKHFEETLVEATPLVRRAKKIEQTLATLEYIVKK